MSEGEAHFGYAREKGGHGTTGGGAPARTDGALDDRSARSPALRPVSVVRLTRIRDELPCSGEGFECGSIEPVVPGDLSGAGACRRRDARLLKGEPVRAGRTGAQNREYQARCGANPQLLLELPRRGGFVRLADGARAAARPVALPRQAGSA